MTYNLNRGSAAEVEASAAPLPARLGTLIALIARQWRRALDARLQPFDLTEATWTPLVHLARAREPMRQKDLAAALFLDSSSVVRVLANLEEAGLVERGEDGGDRRAKAIVITPAGRKLALRVERSSEAMERELLAAFDPGDLATARRVLAAISVDLGRINAAARRP